MSGAAGAPTISRNSSVNDSDIIFVEDMPIDGDSSCGCGVYRGQFNLALNVQHGQGRMEYFSDPDIASYDGEWVLGSWQGTGTLVFHNNDTYIGEFVQSERHGTGIYSWNDNRVYEGTFEHDKRSGVGVFSWPDGSSYEGEFQNGKRSGKGKYTFANSNSYEGEWVNGKYNGKGIFRWNDGRHYSGEWKDSLQHGFGTEYRADGSTRHRGQWFEQRPVDDHGLSLDDSVDNLFYNHDESAQQHSAQQSQQSSSMEVASADHSENQTGINDARAVPAPPQGAPMHTLNPGRKPPPVYRNENKNPVGPSMNPPPLRARTSSGSSASSMPGRQIRSVVPPAHQSNRQLQVSEDSNRAASMPLSSPIRPYSSEGRAPMPGRGRVGARGGRGMPRQFPSSSSVGSTRSLQTAPPVLTQQAGAGTSMRSLRPSLVQQSMRGGSTRSGMSASVASSRSLMSNFTSATGTAGSVRSLATIQSAGSQSSGMNSHETEAATINTNGIVDSKPQTANRNPSVHEQAIPKSPRTMTMTGSVVSSPTNSPKSSSRARPNTSRMNSTSSSLAPPLRTQSTAPRVAVPRKAGSVEAAGPPPTAMMRSQSARPTMMQHQYASARIGNNHNTAYMVPSLHGDGGMVDPRQQQTLGNSNRHHRDRSADSPKFSPMRSTRQMFSRTLSRLSPRSSRNVVSSSMNRDTDTMSVPEATSQRSKKGLFSKMSKRFGGKKQRQQRQQQQQQQQQQQGDPQSHLPPSQSEVQPVQTSSREDLLQNVLPPQLQSEFDE